MARFIPVHTGNTRRDYRRNWIQAVYPCAYREHINRTSTTTDNIGLSLCIQGTLSPNKTSFIGLRFIPVHTGNTLEQKPLSNRATVYPCAYREHIYIRCRLCLGSRFIPVHTGNTTRRMRFSVWCAVYPCAYREHPNYNILFYN